MSRLEISTSIDSGIASAGHYYFDGMRDNVDRATAFHARRLIGVEDVHRNMHPNGGPFRHTQKVDMHRKVFDRVELEVARDNPMLGAVHIDIVKRGQKAPSVDTMAQFIVIDQDHERGFVLSVDHARHFAGATRSPSGPLAAFRTCRRLHFLTVAMLIPHLSQWKKAAFRRLRTRQASRGAGGRERGGL